jgi:hypothetical protein
MTNFQRSARILALLAGFSALSACGPNLPADEAAGGLRSPDSFSYQSVGEYSCPTEDNVLPYQDEVLDGSQRYTVCTHSTSPTRVFIEGWSSTDRTVCVFPLHFVDASRYAWKMDSRGSPIAFCYDASSTVGKSLDFMMTGIDGAVVVDYGDRDAMARCLSTGMGCPSYSIGRFR